MGSQWPYLSTRPRISPQEPGPADGPYGGFLHGVADVTRAQGEYLILREKAIQERQKTQQLRRENRRQELKQWYWERELKAVMREKEAERDRASMIKAARTDPSLT